MNMLRENMRLIAECSQQLVSLGENLWGKGTTKEDVSFDTESEWLKHEITLPDGYIFKDENGNVINAMKIVLEKKKKEYPKTYEECCDTLTVCSSEHTSWVAAQLGLPMNTFIRLLVARNAYWKIAGEEMGLGKPWEPDFTDKYSKSYVITAASGIIHTTWTNKQSYILAFPTEEMRDAFKKNFDPDLEICKELL